MNDEKNKKISVHCILACLYFLLLPTTIAVNSAGNSILKLATIPIAGFFVISIIYSKKALQFNSVHFLLCLYTFSTLFSLYINPSSDARDTVLGYLLNSALYLCITVVQYNEKELKMLENTQILLLLVLVPITLLSEGSEDGRTTLMFFGQTSDPNYFVGFFIFPLTVVFKKILQSQYRILYVLLAVLSLYCIFLSGSRGGLLAVIVTIAAFAIIYPAKFRTKLVLFGGGCAFLLIVWFGAAPFLPENIIERMSVENVVETGGTGRWYIWGSMLDEIVHSSKDLFFGRGFNVLHAMFLEGTWDDVGAHNQVIQVLYNQGVIGLVAFTVLTVGCFFHCVKKRKTVAIAIVGMMALSISLSFNPTTRTFWNLIAYAAFNFTENKTSLFNKTLKLPEENEL